MTLGTLTKTAGLLLLVAAILTTCTVGEKQVKIRFKFEPGSILHYRQITQGIVRSEDIGRDSVLYQNYAEATMDIQMEVRRILEDSSAELVETKTYFERTVDLLDSTSTDTVGSETKDLTPLITYVKPNGMLIDLEYADDTAQSGLEYLKEYYRQGFPKFPDKAVGQGHSWTQTTRVVLPDGPVEASTTYTVKGFARERGYDCVIIAYDGISILPLPQKKHEIFELVAGINNIATTGHMYFAYMDGITVAAKERWVMDSERTLVRLAEDSTATYQIGDTLRVKIGIEYDVDYSLQSIEQP